MKVGWLHDQPGYIGGAELTQAEFRAKAPGGVEIVDCPSGGVVIGCDRYVLQNVHSYSRADYHRMSGAPKIKYHHDVAVHPDPVLRAEILDATKPIYCSPLQRERIGIDGDYAPLVPPALDLTPFKAVANQNHRKGAVCIGRMAYGKGIELLAEYEEPVDIYSSVPCRSQGNAHYQGPTSDVAETLSHYDRFVFLPTAIEPFGRAVVEAWAAGLAVYVNKNVGSRYWIEEKPEGLATASERFWEAVCG